MITMFSLLPSLTVSILWNSAFLSPFFLIKKIIPTTSSPPN
jgi:hypothetical protein